MKRQLLFASTACLVLLGASASAALAAPPDLTDTAFVCPVLGGQAGTHGEANGISPLPTGAYTVGGPEVTVPVLATNDEGAGSPAGPQAAPGDVGYTAIWSFSSLDHG